MVGPRSQLLRLLVLIFGTTTRVESLNIGRLREASCDHGRARPGGQAGVGPRAYARPTLHCQGLLIDSGALCIAPVAWIPASDSHDSLRLSPLRGGFEPALGAPHHRSVVNFLRSQYGRASGGKARWNVALIHFGLIAAISFWLRNHTKNGRMRWILGVMSYDSSVLALGGLVGSHADILGFPLFAVLNIPRLILSASVHPLLLTLILSVAQRAKLDIDWLRIWLGKLFAFGLAAAGSYSTIRHLSLRYRACCLRIHAHALCSYAWG